MNGKKVLILGANGMLGSNLFSVLQCEKIVGLCSNELDITDSKIVYKN